MNWGLFACIFNKLSQGIAKGSMISIVCLRTSIMRSSCVAVAFSVESAIAWHWAPSCSKDCLSCGTWWHVLGIVTYRLLKDTYYKFIMDSPGAGNREIIHSTLGKKEHHLQGFLQKG